MNQLSKSVMLLTVYALCACTGRSTNTGTSPAPSPVQPDNQQPSNETQQTDQTESTTDDNEQITPTETGEQTTNEDVIDPTTPTTTSPETTTTPTTDPVITPPTPTNNPTGTVDIQGSDVTFQDLKFTVPSGWKLHQDAISAGTLIMAFTKGTDYFRIYARQGALPSLQSVFVNGSQVIGQERDETIAGRSWKRIDTQKGQVSVAGFAISHSGHAYFGFGRSSSGQAATAITAEFLGSIKQ